MKKLFDIIKKIIKPYIKLLFPRFCGQNLMITSHIRLSVKFMRDYLSFVGSSANTLHEIKFNQICPRIYESEPNSQSGGGEYFQQDIWALTKVYSNMPNKHIDIGSRIDGFTAQCSVMVPVEFLDCRYVDYNLPNMSVVEGDLLNLPYQNDSVCSISCLHTLEHVGLGRYGDSIDVLGMEKSILELIRVLGFGGNLYISFPVSPKSFVEFNAHRITNPKVIYNLYMHSLELVEFSVVKDNILYESIKFDDFINMDIIALGLFHLRKVA